MTLQVGMLGTDGIVLAGDTRLSRIPRPGFNAPWQSYNGPKILLSPSGRIAVSCAHDMQTGKAVGEAIFAGMTRGDDPSSEQQIREIASSVAHGPGVECPVAFSDPLPSLYVFRYAKGEYDDDIESQRVIECAATGDTRNPAVFWGMMYYRALPVEKLKHLAACMIASGSQMNSAIVNGLEMVFCTKDGCRRLDEGATVELLSTAKTRIEQVGDLILNGRSH
jgi:hypothetical protein